MGTASPPQSPELLLVDEQHQGAVEQVANLEVAKSDSANREIQVDTDVDDVSSGGQIEEDFERDYVYENGRRYANETCLFPNDEAEETRLAIIHQIHLSLLHGDLSLSHGLRGINRILDVGSGPGDWAIAIGEAFPSAQVIATDVVTYLPVSVPPNVEFRIEDASQEWVFEDKFDYIHFRDMHSLPDFPYTLRQARKWLNDRGTFEFVAGGPISLEKNYENSALESWNGWLREGMKKAGMDNYFDFKDEAAIAATGLHVYKQKTLHVRMGDWSTDAEERRLGRMALVATCEGIEAASLRLFTKYLEWPVEQAQELIEKVQAELMDIDNEASIEVTYLVARCLQGY